MKKNVILIISFFLSSWLFGQSTLDVLLDVNFSKVSIEAALKKVNEHPKIQISYSSELLTIDKEVTLFGIDLKLKEVLENVLDGTNLRFKAIGNQVVIFKSNVVPTKKRYPIYGYIEDALTGERLIGANIYESENMFQGVTSNGFGYFNLSILEGDVRLVAQYVGYENFVLERRHKSSKLITIKLKPATTDLGLVLISGKRFEEEDLKPITNIDKERMKLLPALGGETDLMRNVNTRAGVQSGAEGIGGTHVRGGGSDQNLILLDDAPVYNPSHTWGIYSIFDDNTIKDARVFTNGFPTKYGGRLSSVVDVRTKDGNKHDYEKELEIGLLSGKFRAEGPIIKDKASFILSGRTSFTGLYSNIYFSNQRREKGVNGTINYHFYDVNAKLNYSPNNKNRIHLSYYKGNDSYDDDYLKDTTDVFTTARFKNTLVQDWGNTIGTFRWNRSISNKMFGNLSVTYSKFNYQSTEETEAVIRFRGAIQEQQSSFRQYNSNIEDRTVKMDFDYFPNQKYKTRFGVQGTLYKFQPGIVDVYLDNFDSSINPDSLDRGLDSLWEQGAMNASQASAYLEQELKFFRKGSLSIGAFASVFLEQNKNWYGVDPRLRLGWKWNKEIASGFNFESMTQYLHLLSPYSIGLPEDIWVSVTDSIPPQRAFQYTLWSTFNLKKGETFTISGYYKKLNNLIDVKDELAYQFNANDWETVATTGKGESYGVELELSKSWGDLFDADINYTYSKSTREFEELNFNGKPFPYRYDRRHVGNFSGTYNFSKRLKFSAAFTFGTGLAITQPVANYVITPINFPPINIKRIDTRNNTRMPNFHRLDIGGTYDWLGTVGVQKIKFSIHNIYFRQNAIFYELRKEKNDEGEDVERLYHRYVPPFLPSFSYTLRF